jgi:hypothetical protein
MRYQEDLGYEVITRPLLYQLYYLPGSVALCLLGLGLLGVITRFMLPVGRPGKAGVILTYLTIGLAVGSALGAVIPFAPLSVAGRSFGSLSLGVATLLLGVDLWRRHGALLWPVALLVLGGLGIFMFALWPLVFAFQLVSASVATGLMTLFGIGWAGIGYGLRKVRL